MQWSLGVNESVAEIVYNLPPFPGVREALQRLQGIDRFFSEQYAGSYEDGLLKKFQELLPDTPPW